MSIERNFLAFLAILLTAVMAGDALGEVKTSYTTQGNNVGAIIGIGLGGPVWGRTQFPRGSGNFFGINNNSKWDVDSDDSRINWGVNVARDADGDGVSEDTVYNQHRGAHIYGCNNTLESYSTLESLYNAGNNMFEAASEASVSRVYTSLDKDDLANWPPEFREGRSESGEPHLVGVETVCVRFGDSFHKLGAASGVSMEYQFYLLNYGESNNMIYSHTFIRNMSEYNKWNPNLQFAARMSQTPDGQVWQGFQLHYAQTYMNIGGRDEGWMFYSPKSLLACVDKDNNEGSFAGNVPAMFAVMPLSLPAYNGETMGLTNFCAHGWSTEYGFSGSEDVLEGGYSPGKSYRYGLGKNAGEPFYPGLISPWTNEQAYGYPGVLEPGDDRYEQWMWGGANSVNNYVFWSELHDFAPRDTTSFDWVMMFVMPPEGEWVMPQSEMSEIDNVEVQDHAEPVLFNAEVAELVYEGGYILPESPQPPPLTIVPGDREVTITWSDINFQTPDSYYGFLQQHPELDPDGVYVEYDMEGYRLYRSFVGPSDSHSELIFQCSKSDNNVQFYYVDSYDDDQRYRLWNGKKVWYALVPYDKNYDTDTGVEYSLPELDSGKAWNRAGENLYTVIPRSDASNYKAAGLEGGEWHYLLPGTADCINTRTFEIAGDGTGKLTEPPVFMAPPVSKLEFVPVLAERITEPKTLYVACSEAGFVQDQWCISFTKGVSVIELQDGSETVGAPQEVVLDRTVDEASMLFNGPVHSEGVDYGVEITFSGLKKTSRHRLNWIYQIDQGAYTGGNVYVPFRGCWRGEDETWRLSAPHLAAFVRNAEIEVTWVDAGGGNLTLEVTDNTRGVEIPYAPYIDDHGWGFFTLEGYGRDNMGEAGTQPTYYDYVVQKTPRDERTLQMEEALPADNIEQFGIFVNGILWKVAPPDDNTAREGVTMPSAGTTWKLTSAFGEWNLDQTVFTQWADAAWVGDKWELKVTPTSMDAENTDMSLISVVPNPYLASSTLDLSPDSRRIEFVNLPDKCTVRIYSLGGNLVNVLNHIGTNRHGWGDYTDWDRLDTDSQPLELNGYDNHGGTEPWNLRNRFGQTVASGLYFYVVTDQRGETHTGKFYIVN